MRTRPEQRENSGAALLAVLPIALIAAIAVSPAGAQTATSTSGAVGSAASRNGYPAGGGAIVLPVPTTSGNATTATGATPATGAGTGATSSSGAASGSSASGSGGSGSAGATATASTGGVVRSSGTSGGAHWVLCPPGGSSGLLPLFTGTDLSCTPDE